MQPNTKTCPSCQLEINEKATKCVHCSSPQNKLLRWLNNWSFVAGATLSTISLCVIAYTALKKISAPNGADLTGNVLILSNSDHLKLAVKNKGNETAYIAQAYISWKTKYKGKNLLVSARVPPNQINKAVQPGRSLVLDITGPSGSSLPLMPTPASKLIERADVKQNENCKVQIIYGDPEQQDRLLTIGYTCFP
jgi:hypothetical protein